MNNPTIQMWNEQSYNSDVEWTILQFRCEMNNVKIWTWNSPSYDLDLEWTILQFRCGMNNLTIHMWNEQLYNANVEWAILNNCYEKITYFVLQKKLCWNIALKRCYLKSYFISYVYFFLTSLIFNKQLLYIKQFYSLWFTEKIICQGIPSMQKKSIHQFIMFRLFMYK